MESESESATKVEMIKQAIKEVMEDVGNDDDRHRLLLSKLMSQLEGESIALSKSTDKLNEEKEEEERIVKELKKVRRQNVITHCLLSVMIVVTVVWQISEVSIILKLKDGVSHPFRAIGGILKGMIRPPRQPINDDDLMETSITSNLIESTPVNDIKLPLFDHLPKVDLLAFLPQED